MDCPRVQAMFKRSRHNNLSIFIMSLDYYDLSKKQYVVMVMYVIYLNRLTAKMFKIFIKIRLPWI